MKYLFVTFILSLTLCSTIHKDLNEFGKWKKFHGIFDKEFKQVGSEIELDAVSYEYDHSNNFLDVYKQFFIHSKDSTKFIDLDTYSLVLEKDQLGNLYSSGSGVDIKVQLVDKDSNSAITALFCGTNCYPETALWRNNSWLEIYGFELDDGNRFIPTMWKILTDNMLFSKYQIDKKIDKMPESYSENVRLKKVEFKK